MHEPGICPVCQAFQDPDTGKCLICDKSYTILNIEPIPLKGFGRTQDFAIPITDGRQHGFLTIQGNPKIVVENNGHRQTVRFDIEAHPYINDNKIFSVRLF